MDDSKLVWDLLMEKIGNPYGVAGIMGNLMAESSMNAWSMTGKRAKQFSPSMYIECINGGSISKDEFAHDGIAFGLAQWLFWSRKAALYDYAKGQDIGSVRVQIGYLLAEMPKYKAVWPVVKNATTIAEASDAVLEKYERPATINDAVRAKRSLYGQRFFDRYSGTEPGEDVKRYSVWIRELSYPEAEKLKKQYGENARIGEL